MKRFVALTVAALMLFGTASGCAKTKSSNATPITACVGSEPKSIDPAINQAVDGSDYIVHLFEGLYKTNKNNQIVPGIAQSADVSKDGLTWTLHLRTDAKWSDGKPVTAGDFVYSWQRAVNPATASAYAYQLDYIKNAHAINIQAVDKSGNPEKVKVGADGKPVEDTNGNPIPDANGKYVSANADGTPTWLDDLGIKAKDDHTLVVTLEAPCSYITQIFAFPTLYPVRKDVVEKNPDTWATDPKTLVCDGPYTITSWTHSSKIVMKKSDTYYDKSDIVANEIDWILMDDDNATLTAFKNHKILLADSMPPEEIPALVKSGECKIYGNLGTYYYDFNTKQKPFDNVNVRKAFTLAFDRQYLCTDIAKAGQQPAGAFVPSDIPDAAVGSDFRKIGGNFYNPTTAGYKANIAEAQKLLADAGYPGGKGFPTVELKYNTNAAHQAIAEYLQSEWQKNLGIKVSIVNEEWAVLQADRNKGNFQLARDAWLGDYVDPMTFIDLFTSTSGNNSTGWKNAQYDALVSDAMKNTNQATRMKDMHSAEKILMTDYPVCPVYYYTDPDLVSPKLQGYVHSALGYKYLMWASVK